MESMEDAFGNLDEHTVAYRGDPPAAYIIVDDVPTATEAEVQEWFESTFEGEVTAVEGQPGMFLDSTSVVVAYDPQPPLSKEVLLGLGVPADVVDEVGAALQPMPEPVIHGDYLVNPLTGEIVGLVAEEKTPFRIQSQTDLEWVMSLFFEAEAEVDAAKRRTEALLENARALTAEKQRRVDFLKFRFTGDLEHWTHEKLDGLKERSVKTPFGTLGFRKTQGSIEVLNREAAIKFLVDFEAHLELPGDVVRTAQTVSVSALKGHESKLPPDLFVVTPSQDRFYMKSGVGK